MWSLVLLNYFSLYDVSDTPIRCILLYVDSSSPMKNNRWKNVSTNYKCVRKLGVNLTYFWLDCGDTENQENGCIPTTVTHTLNSAENRRAPIEAVCFLPSLCCSLRRRSPTLLSSLYVNHGLTLVWLSTELRHWNSWRLRAGALFKKRERDKVHYSSNLLHHT